MVIVIHLDLVCTHTRRSNHAGACNSSFTMFVCAIIINMIAKIFINTWISHFSFHLSTFRFIMGLVLGLLMNVCVTILSYLCNNPGHPRLGYKAFISLLLVL